MNTESYAAPGRSRLLGLHICHAVHFSPEARGLMDSHYYRHKKENNSKLFQYGLIYGSLIRRSCLEKAARLESGQSW